MPLTKDREAELLLAIHEASMSSNTRQACLGRMHKTFFQITSDFIKSEAERGTSSQDLFEVFTASYCANVLAFIPSMTEDQLPEVAREIGKYVEEIVLAFRKDD